MTTDDTWTQTRAGRQVSPEESFWNRKSDEAFNSRIYHSIEKEGIVNPVRVGVENGELGIRNGYHRVAVANSIDPSMFVPITYKVGDPEAQSERLPGHVHREDETYLHELED